MSVEAFQIAEHVIRMRDPAPWWKERVRVSRERLLPATVLNAHLPNVKDEEAFEHDSFWFLIHPSLIAEAMPRFNVGHYADAVEAALKVVSQEIRDRTGLTVDGAALMRQAFSLKNPYLVFDDPTPATRDAMQQGYMEIFAGTMMGVRNPKAHCIVRIDRRRCIHFLFLASLLADKVEEARAARPTEEGPVA
jgi:uncharacterized protein (TIGR02391 family)